MSPLFVTFGKASERWPIGKTALRECIASGRIHAVKFGRRTWISVSSADEYFKSLPAYPVKRGQTNE